jgi:uncharacterized protein YbjT (DUF2867 family)
MAMDTTLVVGATGVVGSQIVIGLARAGRPVRALVRTSSDPAKVAALKEAGAELVVADLKDRASLDRACAGVASVIQTATSTGSRAEGDAIATVDGAGSLALIEAAKAAGVKHYVLISFPRHEIGFPLRDAKAAAEDALIASGMGYTILQPPHLWEVWCSPGFGFDVASATARVYGTGEGQHSWMSAGDLAKAAIASLDNPAAQNRVLAFGGPEPLSQLEIVRRFEAATGKKFEVQHVPADALQGQLDGDGDDLARSFAALLLITGAGGWVFDQAEVKAVLGIEFQRFDDFVAAQTRA